MTDKLRLQEQIGTASMRIMYKVVRKYINALRETLQHFNIPDETYSFRVKENAVCLLVDSRTSSVCRFTDGEIVDEERVFNENVFDACINVIDRLVDETLAGQMREFYRSLLQRDFGPGITYYEIREVLTRVFATD